MPKVSVSIPCYNIYNYGDRGETWLRTAIESVLDQTLTDLELLLVDDGSSDATLELLREYRSDDRVTVISQENRGYPGARNTGLERGDGEYYAFIGQDDVWEPEMLETQVSFLEANDSDVIHANAYHIDADGAVTGVRHESPPPQPKDRRTLIRQLFFRNFICEQTTVCHRSTLREHRFDESFPILGDQDLWLRIADDHEFGYVDEVLVRKRYHGSNISGQYENLYEERRRLVEKFVSRYPFLEPYRDAKLSSVHLTHAIKLMLDERPLESRQAAGTAIRLHPTNWKAYGVYLLSFGGSTLGEPVIARLSDVSSH